MKKSLAGLFAVLLLVSCHDVKKQKQLDEVRSMISALDSTAVAWENAQSDSVAAILADVTTVEENIRRNYSSADTITLEFGQKLEAYKQIRTGLTAFNEANAKVLPEVAKERSALEALQRDIQAGAGDRSAYDEYIRFEKNKVRQLNVLLHIRMETKTKCVNSYRELQEEVRTFSEPH